MFGMKKKPTDLAKAKSELTTGGKIVAPLVEYGPTLDINPKEAFGTLEWFEALSDADYEALLTHLRNHTTKIFSKNLFEFETWTRESRSVFLSVLEALSGFTKETRSSADSQIIHNAIFGWIAPSLENAKNYSPGILMSTHDIIEIRDNGVSYVSQLMKIKNVQNKQSIFDGLEISGISSPSTPNTTTYLKVDEGVKNLWTKVTDIDFDLLNAEDQYFMEQVAGNYLPGLVTDALKLKSLKGPIREEAENNFVTQLSLMEEKVDRIVSSSIEKVMFKVRTQTEFLVTSTTDSEMKELAQ